MCRFLLASLNIEAILEGVTIGQRRKILKEMARGSGLSDAYTATITRLKAQKGNRQGLGLQALMWVLCSERPLRAEELCDALGVEIGSAGLDPENIPALRTIQASCLGLLTVEASSSTVRLVHFTLQEHLSRDPTLSHSSHSKIAEVCLTYLNFGSVRDLSPTLHSAPPTMPLLEYASLYWAEHAKRGMTETIKILGLRLLEGPGIIGEHISARLLQLCPDRGKGYRPYFDGRRGLTAFTGLISRLLRGITDVIAAIMQSREADVNAADSIGSRALYMAIFGGQEAIVKTLLDQEGVSPNEKISEDGWTPLLFATILGHEAVVKILLERGGVSPDQPDTKYGRTPLGFAAEGGHEGIVKLLLAREDVNPNQPDTKHGRIPLSWAALGGYEGVVKVLLERKDVHPDLPDTEFDRTALSWAALCGNEGIVNMLLERGGVNPDRPENKNGQTPLSWAAFYGREGIVKTLLEQDVNPNLPDTKHGRTPLSWAAENGHQEVVKILLAREDVNPNQPDTEYGLTPFSWAAQNGHEGVVMMFLEQGMSALLDNENQSPLSLAPPKGPRGVSRIILEQADPDSDKASHADYTSFPLPARPGAESVVEIQSRSSDPNTGFSNFNSQPQPLPTAHDEQARELDRQDSISESADNSPQPNHPGGSDFLNTAHFQHHVKKFPKIKY